MKKIIYFIEFLLVKFLLIICEIIGYKLASNFGFFIGKNFGNFFRKKKSIIENLYKSKIVIKISDNQFANNVLGNYGRILAEYPFLKDFRKNKLEQFIKIDGIENLNKIKNNNKPVVFISGHFNNFELMAMQIEKNGINLAAIYRPLNNVFLNKTMEQIRTKYICKNQIRKGRSGTRQILENLKKGNSIALMIDQRVTEGIKIDFFGNLASTTTIPAQIIKKYECDLVPIYIERLKKYNFKMYVSQPIAINSKKSQEEISKHLNKILEKMILKNPDQWIWTHNRWKK
ncbi:lysophospholipid acyltransferase family protein [Pelagibacterales bacterium SAG-MED16]|jgi:KDO2-lipid IV(A) lauroyltransferase|nr:lysophospholipid acyltransferase family protein [Pelagibacterales bacterium SAG-MED16]